MNTHCPECSKYLLDMSKEPVLPPEAPDENIMVPAFCSQRCLELHRENND